MRCLSPGAAQDEREIAGGAEDMLRDLARLRADLLDAPLRDRVAERGLDAAREEGSLRDEGSSSVHLLAIINGTPSFSSDPKLGRRPAHLIRRRLIKGIERGEGRCPIQLHARSIC